MMSLVSRFEALFVIVLICLSLFINDARAVDEKSQKQDHLLDIIEEKILKTIQKEHYPQYQDPQEKVIFSDDVVHIPQKGSSEKHRTKRIGIAGHENIDLIINALNRGARQRTPMLSMRGTFGKLRQMMADAGR